MRKEWVKHCLKLARTKGDFFDGSRKVLRRQVLSFYKWNDPISLADCGFTRTKMTMLRKFYYHEESIEFAKKEWALRGQKKGYGSVGFTTYNHFIKQKTNSRIGSRMGPCIQSVTLSKMPDGRTTVAAFYRTTEFFKKFPADLVMIRDELINPNFEVDVESLVCYCDNLTIHPMYLITVIPHMEDPIRELELMREGDPQFHRMAVAWTKKYILPENYVGIAKYEQAKRVKQDADKRISKEVRKDLEKYLRRQ